MADPQFTGDWFSPNIPTWERLLAAYKGKPGLQFLEIGCWEGRSACWLLQFILTDPSSRLTCIDTFTGSRENLKPIGDVEGRFDANITAIGAAMKVRKIRARSADALRTLPTDTFDFVYVDGSHDAADVLTDAVLSWSLLRTGGMLIFDDYRWKIMPKWVNGFLARPKPAIDAFLRVFSGEYDVLWKGYQLVVRKRGRPGH